MVKRSLRGQIVRENLSVSLRTALDKDAVLSYRSEFRDEFEANLPRTISFLRKQELSEEDIYRMTAIVSEIGNNSFDHNLGKWPNGFIGNFVALRYNKNEKMLEIVVIDFGIGFKESLRLNIPSPKAETEAIEMGLAGATGRVGEKRGNGLRTVVAWMREYYEGTMRIQSNEGIVIVSTDRQERIEDKKILGTEVYLRLLV